MSRRRQLFPGLGQTGTAALSHLLPLIVFWRDSEAVRLIPPPSWRKYGSRLTPSDDCGAGIWCKGRPVRVQIGVQVLDPPVPSGKRST